MLHLQQRRESIQNQLFPKNMTKTKITTRYYIQASLGGGAWCDVCSKGFISQKQAEREYDRILRECYPTWRGLSICWKIVRRQLTTTTDTEIVVFSTPAHGTKRSLLGEMFVPSWLPEREKKRVKMRPIPGAPQQCQPTSQLPIS